jgi:hypothetical protein
MYALMISSGAPSADTTQYDGDQKCAPQNERVISGQCFLRTFIDEIVLSDIMSFKRDLWRVGDKQVGVIPVGLKKASSVVS